MKLKRCLLSFCIVSTSLLSSCFYPGQEYKLSECIEYDIKNVFKNSKGETFVCIGALIMHYKNNQIDSKITRLSNMCFFDNYFFATSDNMLLQLDYDLNVIYSCAIGPKDSYLFDLYNAGNDIIYLVKHDGGTERFYYAFNLKDKTVSMCDFKKVDKQLISIDNVVYSCKRGGKLVNVFDGDNIYDINTFIVNNDYHYISIKFYDGIINTVDLNTNNDLYPFGKHVRIGTKYYFALSEPIYDEGCRLSTKEYMRKYLEYWDESDNRRCIHSIGKTYIYCYNCKNNSLNVIKELPEGSFVFSIDSENIRYLCKDTIYENDNVIMKIEPLKLGGSKIGYPDDLSSNDDAAVYRYISYINDEYVCLTQDPSIFLK